MSSVKKVCNVFIVWFVLKVVGRIVCLPDVRATCRTVPGLTREQLELCYRASDVTAAAIEGLELAVRECQHQFQWHRWNCSSLSTKSRNPHTSNMLKRGYRESAFAYAIAAAGVTHSVARACAQGRLISCGCDPAVNRKGMTKSLRESLEKEKLRFLDAINENSVLVDDSFKKLKTKQASRWKWGGCSHNMAFGAEFSELFLDTREKGGDIQSQINLHNNHAGRRAVSNNMQVRCKCHGMSGSCQLKTCWKSAPDFRIVGKVLKQQYRRAILVDQSNLGNGPPMIVYHKPKKRKHTHNIRPPRRTKDKPHLLVPINRTNRKMENALFYYQRSPNFCERDQISDIPGTVGRRCNRTSGGSEGCGSMCCGRGYNLVREKRVDRCNCKFHWCCYVECDDCEIEEWISVCN
ncbi:protein Wnt-10a [Malaya genurostris]|uniref:protein Wnt-10a n=1 Tax=Malaya genurostris TaxID=325434 RepID=UPI0026F3AB01|nr:protein Wnt-10a [Malaya genurostris]XP_058452543.1 protein Wnt-10a [Malaya genurostris]XP_058452544.1 protein Wnt-10a [Malaya genurostris]XP_058452545.1 protein Wnt-10a [Malaya genurostris]XP_058452546.1 protein Wnt-10a [Malaya genurostris]XP_058452547.1 protein Wnt-10a [Malaya genurostris]XP_058452548.1 protein Wnt-10a [Malaya genurostris]XP_058452550.1 protein Wnt-10a [Malaya genurostris]